MMRARRLALIPARGGSKRFPRKNVALLGGISLVERAVEVARAADVFDRIIVSSEDAEIRGLAARAGAEIHERTDELASDTARVIHVCTAVLGDQAARGESYDVLCVLLPTSPFRRPHHVTESLALLERDRANVVMSVAEFPHVPFWAVHEVRGFLRLFWGRRWLKSRPSLPRLYRHNGAVLWARPDALARYGDFYCPRTAPYYMGLDESVDVDTPLDLEFAQFLWERRKT
jgi:CMP-N-acetylneuraminic acid synthetase